MINADTILGGELLTCTVKLQQLQEAVARLELARIACSVSLDVCFMLGKEAIKADESERSEAVKAFAYAISITARQIRLEIAQKPRRAQMLKNIALDAKKVQDMKVGTYRALEPFALKIFEEF